MSKIVDETLGIKKSATQILLALKELEPGLLNDLAVAGVSPEDWSASTSALYNGRECGICISVTSWHRSSERLAIFFSESRNSDGVFVQSSVAPNRINPPIYGDFSEDSYRIRREFNGSKVNEAAKSVSSLIYCYLLSVSGK